MSVTPVIHAEAVEARNTATRAWSSGSPTRARGVLRTNAAGTSGLSPRNAAASSVLTRPGAIALTRIPIDAYSRAATFVNCETAAFAEQYAASMLAGAV